MIKAASGKLLRCVLPLIGTGAGLCLDAAKAYAGANQTDLAGEWISFLFKGGSLGGGDAGSVSFLAAAVREALGVYSVSMLVLAGLVLAWQVASMVAETAHTGVVMGRRANQLWVPLRFLFGIGLLIPLGGGLSLGQTLLVKMAEHGSALASDIWQETSSTFTQRFEDLLEPRAPDSARLILTALEMETCRSLYHHLYLQRVSDPIVAVAGDMPDFLKIQAGGLGDETWLYANSFFPSTPLCGAYRFYSPVGGKRAPALAEASRALAERLVMQSRLVAERITPALIKEAGGVDYAVQLDALVKEENNLVHGQLGPLQASFAQEAQAQADDFGWIGAGLFLWQRARWQAAFDELAQHALPQVSAPILGHRTMGRGDWYDAARTEPGLRALSPNQFDPYVTLYDKTSHGMQLARAALASRAAAQGLTPLPDSQDLADRMAAFTDADAAQTVLSRMMREGAGAFGLWPVRDEDTAVGETTAAAPMENFLRTPLAALATRGSRLLQFGLWALGMTSPAFFHAGTASFAFAYAIEALCFIFSGFVLLYVVPFAPLLRTILATVGWIVSVLSAIVSLPLVALAHLYPAGDGFSGPLARRAYWLWLSLFLQPTAIVFGLMGGLFVFCLLASLLQFMLFGGASYVFFGSADVGGGLHAALTLIHALLMGYLAFVCFRGVTELPARLLSWIDSRAMPESLLAMPPGGPEGATVLLGAPQGGPSGGAFHAPSPPSQGSPTSHAGKTARTPQALDAALFPSYPEPPAASVVIARAEAAAAAKAEGKEGASAEALASAASPSDKAYARAMAMNRQMAGGEKHIQTNVRGALIPPLLSEDKEATGPQKMSREEPKKGEGLPRSAQSPEQSAISRATEEAQDKKDTPT